MIIALDTNAYTAIQIGNVPDLKRLVEIAERIIFPFIVDAELRAGFQKGQKQAENYNKLNRFQSLDSVLLQWPDDATNELYAQIWADLAKRGNPIPTNDVWIAAICLQHQLTLATNDAHFRSVPLLQLQNF